MSDNAERNKQIYYTRADGATFKAIANKYGVTVERVRQIYHLTGQEPVTLTEIKQRQTGT